MTTRKASFVRQHETLRVPEHWTTQERRFVAQLEEVFEDIYRHFGRLEMTDLGAKLTKTITDTAQGVSENTTSIEQTAEAITLMASQSDVDDIVNGTTAIPKVENSAVKIDAQGIEMTGGTISMAAESALLLSSGGVVDINGATGSIDLGNNSQMSANSAQFNTLRVDSVPYLPVIVSDEEPTGVENCLWAKPQQNASTTTTSSVSAYASTPNGQTAEQGFNTNYGTPDNPHEFSLGSLSKTLSGDSITYKFTLPLYRAYSGDKTKTLALRISRGSRTLYFPNVTVSVSYGQITTAQFSLTSSTNLFTAGLASSNITATVWATQQNADSVVIKANSTMFFRGSVPVSDGGADEGTTQCELYYIPPTT